MGSKRLGAPFCIVQVIFVLLLLVGACTGPAGLTRLDTILLDPILLGYIAMNKEL